MNASGRRNVACGAKRIAQHEDAGRQHPVRAGAHYASDDRT
jgi:hypothetical protein